MTGKIETVGVIGAGQMGNGIAHVAAVAGYKVLLHDMSTDRIEAGLATINGNMARQVASGKLSEEERKAATARVRLAPPRSRIWPPAISSSRRRPRTKPSSGKSSSSFARCSIRRR
jgi:glycerol-3-phosphate dehydrogenase